MYITSDYHRKKRVHNYTGLLGSLHAAFSITFWAVLVYRFGRFTNQLPLPFNIVGKILYFILFYIIQSVTGISVQAFANIGRNFVILEQGCIFVVAQSIGMNFTVSSGVTVGNVRGSKRLPILGDNVFIEPGAKVLGEVTIGNNVVIRANSLVLADVPDNSIAVGNPARVIPMTEEQMEWHRQLV